MDKKIISLFLACACLLLFFVSCGKQTENASSIPSSEELVIGSIDESEYPDSNSNITFSDVSVPLSEIISSKVSSNKSSSETKNSSSNKTSSLKNSSSSAETSSVQSDTKPSSTSTSSSVLAPTSSGSALVSGDRINYSVMKAVWISYIDFASILTNKTESQFKTNFEKVCKNSVDFGLNTVVCQVRIHGDAVYPSQYFTWSHIAAGIGKNPEYDPLKIMVEIAHKYNLSFQAWINPFRTFLNTDISKVPESTVFKKWYNDSSKKGKNIVLYNGRWYYNPAEPEARELILNGVAEIINNYKVDGIHFDDYFYPTTDTSFDSQSYQNYGNGKLLADFRRDSVTKLIKAVYDTVKKVNKNIIFGISPQANISNDMNVQYADVNLWSKNNGYIDYICPQVYYSYKSESLDFKKSINEWNNLVTASNVKLMIGLAPYRIGWLDTWACNNSSHTESTADCGKYGWRTNDASSSNILASQVADSFALNKCKGVFLYSYTYVFNYNNFSGTSYSANAKAQAEQEMIKLKQALK